jgi:hypothetical protein
MELLEIQSPTSGAACRPIESRRPRIGLKDLALAASLSTLCFIHAWPSLLLKSDDDDYFNKIPVTLPVLFAMAANLIMLAALFWVAGQFVRRSNSKLVKDIAFMALCAVLLIPLNHIRRVYWGVDGAAIIKALAQPWLWLPIIAAAAALIVWRRRIGKAASTVVLILSPVAVLVFGQLSYQIAKAGLRKGPPPSRSNRAAVAIPGPRVVWIIFDELDYRIAFAERPAAIDLPEVDRLCKESLVATNAFPPAGSTVCSIPGLTIGKTVTAARVVDGRELALQLRGHATAVNWSKEPNVFAKARSIGARTAAVGWYHPYPKVFGEALDACAWYACPPLDHERGTGVLDSMINQLAGIALPLHVRRLQVQLYQRSTANALRFVADPAYRLLFFHLPVPHTPGIYDPNTGRMSFTTFSLPKGYLNNLILMDQTFGRIRRAMEQADTWQNSWIIISSDHWWRDAHRYDGKIDHRVPFIVRAPRADTRMAQFYGAPFNTIVTGDLILSILGDEIQSSTDVSSWLEAHHVAPPNSYSAGRSRNHTHP